ncbi:unnamed protein product [Paramecium primaurelia]|uniref:Uncharacterized protein n=1 Tax=Paramecium primaurelia TaxID=5886 RepID=A0A8S1NTD6_PARPR|nr:unnamed protein product [Paramecium primaurelia]
MQNKSEIFSDYLLNKQILMNSQIINIARSMQFFLSSLGLMEDFRIQRSFKIFIFILRKINTQQGRIIYTEQEEQVYIKKNNILTGKINELGMIGNWQKYPLKKKNKLHQGFVINSQLQNKF